MTLWYGFSGISGIFLGKWESSLSLLCVDFECDSECDCGVPFMLRLVDTIDFNELTGIQTCQTECALLPPFLVTGCAVIIVLY